MAVLPDGLVPSRAPLDLTEATVPAGLRRDHRLAPGRWGVLTLHQGSLTFVDQHRSETTLLQAPAEHVIEPRQLHHLVVDGPFTATLAFFKRP